MDNDAVGSQASQKAKDLHEILSEDVQSAYDFQSQNDTQFTRRSVIRSVMALIEGTCYMLKQKALHETYGVQLSPAERSLAEEQTFELGEGGKPRPRQLFLKIKANVRFAFRIHAKALKTEFELTTRQSRMASVFAYCCC